MAKKTEKPDSKRGRKAERGRAASSERPLLLLDEAAELLRHAPPSAWAEYLLGTGPFVLTFTWFVSRMSGTPEWRSPIAVSAFPLALAHLWMLVWHSRFAARLLALRSGEEPPPANFARILRVQSVYGAGSFLALFPASLLLIPFGWIYAYSQTLPALASRPEAHSLAWKAAKREPGENHMLLLWITIAYWLLFAAGVVIASFIPHLVKMFAAVESELTRNPQWIFGAVPLCLMAMLAYAVVDPLVKSVYVLRAFRDLSRVNGDDIRADWRALQRKGGGK